jgi:hypothetical protein
LLLKQMVQILHLLLVVVTERTLFLDCDRESLLFR